MRQRVDKLRDRCQELLTTGEDVLLEAEATVKLGRLSQFGSGRAYLTTGRIIWIRRGTPVIGPLLLWIPDVLTIELSSVDQIRIIRQVTRAWLRIEASGKMYTVRLGKGPYPALRDNPATTEEWLHAIAQAGGDYAVLRAEARPPVKPSDGRPAGVLLTLLAISILPLWLAGFLLAEVPLVFFFAMAAVSGLGLVAGLLLILKR